MEPNFVATLILLLIKLCDAGDLRSSGKRVKARAFDALIAAVAVSSGLPLFTQNASDYVGITDLVVVPVPQKKF